MVLLFESFKKKLFSLIWPTEKPTYGIYDPKDLGILTQLRVCLRMLKSHKYNHSFRDTEDPICLINDRIEDTEHFLVQFHAYSEQRRDILGATNEVLQLYSVSTLQNQVIIRTMLYDNKRLLITRIDKS